jgi:glycosyltransferase involved in cell wall biosynthesis
MIDQLGELGYGMNSLEALAMGIPTCCSLPEDLESYLQPHPFITVNEENLREKLIQLIEDSKLRSEKAVLGRRWVEEWHDSRRVVARIHSLLSGVS